MNHQKMISKVKKKKANFQLVLFVIQTSGNSVLHVHLKEKGILGCVDYYSHASPKS